MNVNEILELGTEIANDDFTFSAEAPADNNSEILNRLDTVIEGEQAIHNCLWIIIGFLAVTTVVKFLWTFLSKWLFGGI